MRICSRYSTAARISFASHVVQSSPGGSPGTPVLRPTQDLTPDGATRRWRVEGSQAADEVEATALREVLVAGAESEDWSLDAAAQEIATPGP